MLPLRWSDDLELDDLTGYLRRLRDLIPVIVVDGSPPELFDRHAARWQGLVRHVPPDPDLDFANGKVNGVLTGVRRSNADLLILADDDVRYEADSLAEVIRLLGQADLVRPQNYFTELPWHARWDTGRSLLNRCLGADYPGTLGVRRSALVRAGGYDGDVMFENLELIRTVVAGGGREVAPFDLYVGRRPPTARHFLNQRTRQAYDDFAQPVRLAAELSILPLVVIGACRRRWPALGAGAAAAVAVAEVGRRKGGGRRIFPATTALFAPLWCLERGVCVWAAVVSRTRGGVQYRGRRLPVAAHSVRRLRAGGPSRRVLTMTGDA